MARGESSGRRYVNSHTDFFYKKPHVLIALTKAVERSTFEPPRLNTRKASPRNTRSWPSCCLEESFMASLMICSGVTPSAALRRLRACLGLRPRGSWILRQRTLALADLRTDMFEMICPNPPISAEGFRRAEACGLGLRVHRAGHTRKSHSSSRGEHVG